MKIAISDGLREFLEQYEWGYPFDCVKQYIRDREDDEYDEDDDYDEPSDPYLNY